MNVDTIDEAIDSFNKTYDYVVAKHINRHGEECLLMMKIVDDSNEGSIETTDTVTTDTSDDVDKVKENDCTPDNTIEVNSLTPCGKRIKEYHIIATHLKPDDSWIRKAVSLRCEHRNKICWIKRVELESSNIITGGNILTAVTKDTTSDIWNKSCNEELDNYIIRCKKSNIEFEETMRSLLDPNSNAMNIALSKTTINKDSIIEIHYKTYTTCFTRLVADEVKQLIERRKHYVRNLQLPRQDSRSDWFIENLESEIDRCILTECFESDKEEM